MRSDKKAGTYYSRHKEQQREYHARLYQENKEENLRQKALYRERNREAIHSRAKVRRQEDKLLCMQFYSNSPVPYCIRCGIADIDVLTIDHINGGGAKHRREVGHSFYRYLIKGGYPSGYQVLCCNCNMKKRIREDVSDLLEATQ